MDLKLDDFAGCVGERYEMVFSDATLPIELEATQELPRSVRESGAFRLEWRGPTEPILPQGIYRFRRGEQLFDMFIVPVGRNDRGTLYEAVFN
jgi:hypothetical protein